MSLRVLHITRDAPPRDNGGISTALRFFLDGDRPVDGTANYQHSVLSFDGWRPGQPDTPQIAATISKNCVRLSSPAQLESAMANAADLAPDVLHVHDPLLINAALDLQQLCQEARGAFPALVYTAHIVHAAANALRGIERETLSSKGERTAMEFADAVHAGSQSAAEQLRAHYPLFTDKLFVRTWPWPSVPESEATGFSDHPNIVVAARFGWLKGTDVAFDALAQLGATMSSDVSVVWYGGLPDSAKRERRWLRRWAATADAKGCSVDFIGFRGWATRSTVLESIRPGDIFVCTSRYETWGLAVAEAMARGAAVLATRCGGPEELIRDGMNGVLVDSMNPSSIAEACMELVRSPGRRRSLAASARASSWREQAPLESMYRRWCD